jgi:hypothetical protein
MVAERAADLILGLPALPPENVPVYKSLDWQNLQKPATALRKISLAGESKSQLKQNSP